MYLQEGCHFSGMALKALREDADLHARLRQENLLLVTHRLNRIPFRFM